ncbi:MAG: ribonuclease P protein component [Candidatus Gastranaerophilales bacterium]|nr:ribonuclease P protein component [Candidatus Gastranaerophilales bacterium]
MLKKCNRLRKHSAIIATYKQKNIASDAYLSIYFGKEKTDTTTPVKIAFVVSKKIHKRAVVRNKIKRLMRESFRLILRNNVQADINKYVSIVCVAKTKSLSANYSSIDCSIKKLLGVNA